MEAVAECIPTKLRSKHRLPWETITVKNKRDNVKTPPLCNKKNPSNTDTQKLKKAQSKLTSTYLKEQTECIQNQINKIRNSVEDRQSWIAWQTINEESKRKSTSRAKLKTASQKNEYKCGNNISRICLENPLTLLINLSQKLLITNLRCSWCNGYRRRKGTRRHELKSWTTLIAFHIALIPLGKVWIQLSSLQLWVNSRVD